MYFRAQNGTFRRVPLKDNVGFEQANGGMTVYYTNSLVGNSKVTPFQPVCRLSPQIAGYVIEHLCLYTSPIVFCIAQEFLLLRHRIS